MVHALRDEDQPNRARRESPRDEPVTKHDERWLYCKNCGTPIAPVEAILPEGEMPLVFANPHGMVFELLLLSRAHSLQLVGTATDEFTWFSGYTWRVALCGRCGTHLGWRFEALKGGSPPVFFGLLRRELVERDVG